jgi:hypothetical protein
MTRPQVSKGRLAVLVCALDNTYPAGCYTEAVRELPEDARIYSTAESDILAALSRSVGHRPPSRLLQDARRQAGSLTGNVPPSHGSSLPAGVIAALVAAVLAALAALIPLRRRRGRRSA